MPTPPDRLVNDWSGLIAAFPIWKQEDIDRSVGWPAPQVGKSNPDPRVLAWLAYCCTTAAHDRWSTASNAWDYLQGYDVSGLKKEAKTLYQRALTLTKPSDSHAYDVFWAGGFVRLFERAYNSADGAWEEAELKDPHGLSALKAERADALVFLGFPILAFAAANRAIEEAQRSSARVPEWYWWVLGWTRMALAAQRAPGDRLRRHHAEKCLEALDQMTPEYGPGIPWDFDAAIVRLMANFVLQGETSPDLALWGRYRDVVRERKGGLLWTRDLEIERSPFNEQRETAENVLELMQAALPPS